MGIYSYYLRRYYMLTTQQHQRGYSTYNILDRKDPLSRHLQIWTRVSVSTKLTLVYIYLEILTISFVLAISFDILDAHT